MIVGKFDNIDELAPNRIYKENLPHFIRLEYPYSYSLIVKKFMDSFDKRIYLYRNPYDTMISMFYYFAVNPGVVQTINTYKDFKEFKYFEDFCKYHIEGYIAHVEVSIDKADLVLYYDDLKQDPSILKKIVEWLYGDVNDLLFKRALEWSDFKFVNAMEKELKKGQENVVFHARDGRSGQYKELMSNDLINYITEKWNSLKKRVKYEIK
jgi:hypothetical protein